MKKLIIFYFLIAAVSFVGCKKNDGFLPEGVVVDKVPQPNVVRNGGSGSIDLNNLAAFQGKFDVSLLYPNDIAPSKMDVVIRKNNNNTTVKLFQADVTTYPTSFTITAAQIATLFGAPILLGDNYDIGVDIYTKSGTKYQAFPVVGAAYGSTGVANQPGFSPTTRYSAICAYDPAIYTGNFVVVEDAWEDFFPGDVVAFTTISPTSFSFITPAARNPTPIIVSINTGTNVVTITKQVVGSSWAWAAAATYPNPTVSATGSVAPCDKTITLSVQYGFGGTSGGIFGGGPYLLRLRKQ